MKKVLARKVFNLLSFISAGITSIVLICTFLTSYQFFYVGQIFNSYLPLQIGICITMAVLSVTFLLNQAGKRRLIYCGVSIAISISLIFFIANLVK